MKVKLSVLWEALKELSYDFSSYDGEDSHTVNIDVEIVPENPGNGDLIGCIKFTCSTERPPKWSMNADEKSPIVTTRVLEVYEADAQQLPVLTKSESRKIKIK